MTDADRRQLDEQGYLVLPGLMPPELLERVRRRVDELFEEEGDAAGSEFKTRARRAASGQLRQQGPGVRGGDPHPRGAGLRWPTCSGRDTSCRASTCARPTRTAPATSPCTPTAPPSPTSSATGSATRSGCSTTSPRRTAPPAWCRARTSGGPCRRPRCTSRTRSSSSCSARRGRSWS